MASLRRVYFTCKLPTNPEIVSRTHRGKPWQFIRLMENGKGVFFPLTKLGTGFRRPSAKWYGQFADAKGKIRRVPLSENKTAAQQMLNELVRKVEMGKVGIIDPFEDHSKRPLSEHLSNWQQVLLARGNTEAYVELKISRAKKILDRCKFRFMADLSASRVEGALSDLRGQASLAEQQGKPDRFGTQTSNHYLAAVKQFSRWLVADRRTAVNPLAHLEGGNVKLDRRHDRRELSDDELAWLFETVRNAGRHAKLEGPDREMLYLVSAYTGLRASELASLKPSSFNLDDETPTVTVEAAYSKRRREDVVPLHAELVERLRPWLALKAKSERVWPGKWAANKGAGKMLQNDLKHARAAWIADAANEAEQVPRKRSSFLIYRDADGRVADFHALRHTFISRLVRSGARPKEAQTLARHSTITLTMDRYAHTSLHDVRAALGAMPSIPSTGPSANRQIMRATGTDVRIPCPPPCPNLALSGDSGGLRLIVGDNVEGVEGQSLDVRKSAKKIANDSKRVLLSSGGSEIRTHEYLTVSPVFKTGAINRSAIPPEGGSSLK